MKEIVDYIIKDFIDYKGLVHKVVLVAVSKKLPFNRDTSKGKTIEYDVVTYSNENGDDYIDYLTKSLSIGISVCNPNDEFNEEKGIKAATNRAKNNNPVMYVTKSGVISAELVQTLLNKEFNYICENPDIIIPGYKDLKKRYEYNQEMKSKISKLKDNEKTVYEFLLSNKLDDIQQLVEFTKKHE